MNGRFKKEVGDFLLQHGIAFETGIFERILLELAGIKISDEEEDQKTQAAISFNDYASTEELYFNPTRLTRSQLGNVLSFLGIGDDYIVGSALCISPARMFQSILPQFKERVLAWTITNPATLKAYGVKSKNYLEKNAIADIQRYTIELLTICDKLEDHETLKADAEALSTILLNLTAILKYLHDKSEYYTKVLKQYALLQDFILQHPQMANDPARKPLFKGLSDALNAYKIYNRAESAIAVKRLLKETGPFFKRYDISTESCDILEHSLLRMAGITDFPPKCRFDSQHYQSSRFVIYLLSSNKSVAEDFVNFLHRSGDETAAVRKEAMAMQASASRSSGPSRPTKPPENYVVEMDGHFAYATLWDAVKRQIDIWSANEPAILKPYQEQSRERLLELAIQETSESATSLYTEISTTVDTSLIPEVKEVLIITLHKLKVALASALKTPKGTEIELTSIHQSGDQLARLVFTLPPSIFKTQFEKLLTKLEEYQRSNSARDESVAMAIDSLPAAGPAASTKKRKIADRNGLFSPEGNVTHAGTRDGNPWAAFAAPRKPR